MNEDELELTPTRRIEIPTRIIHQAYEHAQATKERYITLLFVGDGSDMTCIGMSTRRRLTGPARPTHPIHEAEVEPAQAAEVENEAWTLQTITDDVIFAIIKERAPIGTQMIGDHLGIAGSNIHLRQRIRRVLRSLIRVNAIRKVGDDRAPEFVVVKQSGKTMPLRPQTERTINRGDITALRVLQELQAADIPISSKTIGDRIGIPRSDSLVRSKITEHIRSMMAVGRIRATGAGTGGQTYQLVTAEPEQQIDPEATTG